MTRPRLAVALGLLPLLIACQEEVVSGLADDAGAVSQFEFMLWRPGAPTIWTVLVIDDAPTEAARSLREHLVADLRGFFDEADGCAVSADPASYRPIDHRLIIVGASGTLEPRFRDEEGLHAFGVDASPGLLVAFEQAAEAAILSMETAQVLPFVGVAELAHYANLVEGAELPRSPAEEELVGLFPGRGTYALAALASTRPDLSPEHLPVSSVKHLWALSLLHWPEDGSCPALAHGEEDIPSLQRLAPRFSSPRCFEEATIFTVLNGKHTCSCLPWAPPADAEGQVPCRVYGEFPADTDCEQMAGWTFLESTQSGYHGEDPWPVNLCELRQAEGAALDACVHDFACEGCEPSFCFRRAFTEADENDPAHERPTPAADHCDGPNGPLPLDRVRLVHGADQIGGAIRVICQK